jgi:hypothetical protein
MVRTSTTGRCVLTSRSLSFTASYRATLACSTPLLTPCKSPTSGLRQSRRQWHQLAVNQACLYLVVLGDTLQPCAGRPQRAVAVLLQLQLAGDVWRQRARNILRSGQSDDWFTRSNISSHCRELTLQMIILSVSRLSRPSRKSRTTHNLQRTLER